MKKLLLFVIACTLGLFTVNAQNRLESITQTNKSNDITYVYEEGTNKVVEVREGVYNEEYKWQIVTFLTYNANGQLISTERGTYYDETGIDKSSYYAPTWYITEYTYTDGKLTSYVEKECQNQNSENGVASVKNYALTYDGNIVTEVSMTGKYYGESYNWDANAWVWGWMDYTPSKRIYTYEDGKLVKEESFYYDQDAFDYFSNNDAVTYTYNEAGNCVSATKSNGEITDYIYDVTKLATDVYSFAFPYEVKPVNTNIIAKAETYRNEMDGYWDAEKSEWVETGMTKIVSADPTYNYSFATVAKPIAPAGLTAEVLSDTEVKLMWDVVADAASYNVYNGTELVAENVTETTFTVTGLTAKTEYTFTVTAVNEGGESDASNAVTTTTLKAVEINFEAIAFGEVTVGGEYWSKVGATKDVKVTPFGKEVKSITVDNAFFTLPETIDFTAETITFAVGYDFNATAGEYEGNLVVTLATDATYTVPMTATAYAPVTPDVFELAQEITFTDGVYTDTPDFATLHDNYSGAPDAVYSFTLEDNQAVEVKVTGTNAKYAIYAEDDFETIIERKDKVLSTVFSYDFNDGSLDDFIVKNDDGNDYTWKLEDAADGGYELASYSYLGGFEGDNWVIYVQAADERIITKAYPITEHSVLSMDIDLNGKYGPEVIVEVTKDGEAFTELARVGAEPEEQNGNTASMWLSKKVNIGAKLAEAGLELGEYQISLRHKDENGGRFAVDNLSLTERGLVYPAGKYFLVASAEDAFTVEVTSVDYTGDENVDPIKPAPAAPVVKATEVGKTSVVLTWEAVETAISYTVYQGKEAIAKELTATTYTVEGLKEDTEYSFTVTATNENGESEASDIVKVKTEKTVLVSPVVEAKEVGETTVTLVWNVVEGAESYNVYQDSESIATAVKETTYTVEGLTTGVEYCFTVTAVRASEETSHSEEVCVTPSAEEGEEPGEEGVEENVAAFNIYPNPAVDRLVIEANDEVETVSIYTITGVVVGQQSTVNSQQLYIDVTSLNSGVYFIKVVTNEAETVQRFIKK